MKYAYFKNYCPNDEDQWVEISQEEFVTLKEHQNDIAMGNVPEEIEELVWETIYDRADLDLRKSEINEISDADVIEIAIC